MMQFAYGTLNYFYQSYLNAFRRHGYTTASMDEDVSLDPQNSFVFFFGALKHPFLVWLHQALPCLPLVNYLVDHPLYYYPLESNIPTLRPVAFDPSWLTFISTRTPQTPPDQTLFLPLPGFAHPGADTAPVASEREIDILFVGSVTDPESIRRDWRTQLPKAAEALDGITDYCLAHEGTDMVTAMKRGLNQTAFDDLHLLRVLFGFADKYVRARFRLNCLTALAEAGLPLTVYVDDPMRVSALLDTSTFDLRPQIGFSRFLEEMTRAKIVVGDRANMHGATERITSAMLNGAVSVSNRTAFIDQTFTDNQDAILYDHATLTTLPERLKTLLADPDRLNTIAQAGQQKAQEQFTPEYHVAQLLTRVTAWLRE